MHLVYVRGGCELFAKPFLAEHLGQFGKQLQVFFRGLLRNQQYEDLADRLAVGGFERESGIAPDAEMQRTPPSAP